MLPFHITRFVYTEKPQNDHDERMEIFKHDQNNKLNKEQKQIKTKQDDLFRILKLMKQHNIS